MHVAVVDLRRLRLFANHRGQHRPVCALRRSFMLLFVGSMCHHAADVSVNFMFGTTIFNQHQLWSSSGAMRVCSDNSCKEDASFRARFFLLFASLTRIMSVHCPQAPGLFFLCISIVNPFLCSSSLSTPSIVATRSSTGERRSALLILQTGDTANEHVVFLALREHRMENVTISSVRLNSSRT